MRFGKCRHAAHAPLRNTTEKKKTVKSWKDKVTTRLTTKKKKNLNTYNEKYVQAPPWTLDWGQNQACHQVEPNVHTA